MNWSPYGARTRDADVHVERQECRNQLAKLIVDIATGETEDTASEARRHPSNKRKGGLVGGVVMAKNLSKERRSAIAKKAAKTGWGRD